MHEQQVDIPALAIQVAFGEGEAIHTENSYKYSFDEIDLLAADSDMQSETRWLDEDEGYSLNLFRPR